MASSLILDKRDQAIADLISDWEDGVAYDLAGLKVIQKSHSETQAVFTVTEVQSEGNEPVLDDEGPPAKPPTKKTSIPISYRK